MRLVLVAGTTATATIDGLSGAGASPDALGHTPGADAEIAVFGRTVRSPVVPVSPTGCPTPAAVTRAVREVVGFPVTVVDGGLAEPTAVRTLDVGASPGGDVRDPEPVPEAGRIHDRARALGHRLSAEPVAVAETIPGGTTTALGVLGALGRPGAVSSSLRDNPLDRKRTVVGEGLDASGLEPGDAAGDPIRAVRLMGDPVLAAVAGLVRGAVETDTPVLLAGGTQLLAAAALVRAGGLSVPLELATTSFLVADDTADVRGLADRLDVAVEATDPGFEAVDHPAAAAYRRGEAKEGVGMGAALRLADRSDSPLSAVRRRFVAVVDRLGAADGDASRTPE